MRRANTKELTSPIICLFLLGLSAFSLEHYLNLWFLSGTRSEISPTIKQRSRQNKNVYLILFYLLVCLFSQQIQDFVFQVINTLHLLIFKWQLQIWHKRFDRIVYTCLNNSCSHIHLNWTFFICCVVDTLPALRPGFLSKLWILEISYYNLYSSILFYFVSHFYSIIYLWIILSV